MKTTWMMAGCVMVAVMIGGYAAGQDDAAASAPAPAQATTQPAEGATTRPSRGNRINNRADRMLDNMLRAKPGNVRPLQPVPEEEQPKMRQTKKVAPEAGDYLLKREGDIITDRVGRLEKAGDWWEFHFESDGRALNDPPMLVLPNQNLATMEAAAEKARWDLRFKVTGMITTYGGRNYLLVEKARGVSRAEEE